MIERDFDISFIADLALREKQIQQNYRPVIAVHKWFARRPGTLFRGLILSEFASTPLATSFYQSNHLKGVSIADPFMGGGTPILEANRVGCDVIGFDINPMSYWIVREEIEPVDLKAYAESVRLLEWELRPQIGRFYQTRCLFCGSHDAEAKYFLWVKTMRCRSCEKEFDLFPGYLLAADVRHPKNVFVCQACGELTECEDRDDPGRCAHCGRELATDGPARRNRCVCPHCGESNSFPVSRLGPPLHRLFAIEYHCFRCKKNHAGRFFKKPDEDDLEKLKEAEEAWRRLKPGFVPEDEIPAGDETSRLHRWGYHKYQEMFNARQLVSLDLSARFIADVKEDRLRRALITNLSDLLRYQNMLCRYDTMALKSLDIFSVHGFPVGLVQCESNFLGIQDKARNGCIGSGGWANIIDKYRKAKLFCEEPFEIRHNGRSKEIIKIPGEWIGYQSRLGSRGYERRVDLSCRDAATAELPPRSLDAVFTDPPYFGNVQYAELMDFCYAWLRRFNITPECMFDRTTTRNQAELTGNENMGRGLEHFTEGLSAVFRKMAMALRAGCPLVFTYHHNDIKAYFPVAVAILDSGLTCSASLPCPGEMGASIHISGTGSSIIDTVFVCRSTGKIPRKWIVESPFEIAALVQSDLEKLCKANVKLSAGDKKCITYGHLTRLAIWSLREKWDKTKTTRYRLDRISEWLRDAVGWPEIEHQLGVHNPLQPVSHGQLTLAVSENAAGYGRQDAEISF